MLHFKQNTRHTLTQQAPVICFLTPEADFIIRKTGVHACPNAEFRIPIADI